MNRSTIPGRVTNGMLGLQVITRRVFVSAGNFAVYINNTSCTVYNVNFLEMKKLPKLGRAEL
jgi:hypothetical protein